MHIINIDLSLKLSCLKNTAVFVDNDQRRICPYSDWSTKFKINSQQKCALQNHVLVIIS